MTPHGVANTLGHRPTGSLPPLGSVHLPQLSGPIESLIVRRAIAAVLGRTAAAEHSTRPDLEAKAHLEPVPFRVEQLEVGCASTKRRCQLLNLRKGPLLGS